jgi:hypothetical protein
MKVREVIREKSLLLATAGAVAELLKEREEELLRQGQIQRPKELAFIRNEINELIYEICNPEPEDEPPVRTQPST